MRSRPSPIRRRLRCAHVLALAILLRRCPAARRRAIEVDGRIDPAEWQGAQHVTDFRMTQPLTGAPAPYPTEAWILATPEGLAIALPQHAAGRACRARASAPQRDEDAQVDRVNLMIDFDGDGRTGYNFTVHARPTASSMR